MTQSTTSPQWLRAEDVDWSAAWMGDSHNSNHKILPKSDDATTTTNKQNNNTDNTTTTSMITTPNHNNNNTENINNLKIIIQQQQQHISPQTIQQLINNKNSMSDIGTILCETILDLLKKDITITVVSREILDSCLVIVDKSPQIAFNTLLIPLVQHDTQPSCELAQHLMTKLFIIQKEEKSETEIIETNIISSLIKAQQNRPLSEHQLFFWQKSVLGKLNSGIPVEILVDIVSCIEGVPAQSTRLPAFIFSLIKAINVPQYLISYQRVLTDILERLSKTNSKNKMMVNQALTELKRKINVKGT
jgi:hypothetical protein